MCERKRAVVNNRDIDPDINYFNTEVTNNCIYYLTEEFNDIVRTHWKPSVQMGMFSIMHMNCRSLLGNFGDIVDFNISLNNVFDRICVTETWVNDSTADLVNRQGLTFVGKIELIGRVEIGEVGIYVKDQIKFKPRTDIDSDNKN